uniref:Suppressor APC domain containing 2 n=1 Tax=Lates calcarifer TaxID=8187 RepID=A0A4W6FMD9_LATCA
MRGNEVKIQVFVPDVAVFLLFKIKRMKDLEKEKDALWSGLEILERTRLWYLQRLEENRRAQCHEQERPLSARNSGRQRPPVAQLSTDSGKDKHNRCVLWLLI